MVYMILRHLEYNDPYIASVVYSCIVGECCFSLLQVSFLMLLVTKVLEGEAVSASVFVALLTVVDVGSVYGPACWLRVVIAQVALIQRGCVAAAGALLLFLPPLLPPPTATPTPTVTTITITPINCDYHYFFYYTLIFAITSPHRRRKRTIRWYKLLNLYAELS